MLAVIHNLNTAECVFWSNIFRKISNNYRQKHNVYPKLNRLPIIRVPIVVLTIIVTAWIKNIRTADGFIGKHITQYIIHLKTFIRCVFFPFDQLIRVYLHKTSVVQIRIFLPLITSRVRRCKSRLNQIGNKQEKKQIKNKIKNRGMHCTKVRSVVQSYRNRVNVDLIQYEVSGLFLIKYNRSLPIASVKLLLQMFNFKHTFRIYC